MGEVPANLEVMDLQARGVNDEALGYGGWLRKGQLHVRAKANDYQTNKPNDDGDWWAHQAPGTEVQVRLRAVTFLQRLPRLVPASQPPQGLSRRLSKNKYF